MGGHTTPGYAFTHYFELFIDNRCETINFHFSALVGMNTFKYPMCNVFLFFFQAHEDLNQGHKTIGIVAYRDSAFADEIRYCHKHTSEPSTMGCRVCWKILCPMCGTTDKKCQEGKSYFMHV